MILIPQLHLFYSELNLDVWRSASIIRYSVTHWVALPHDTVSAFIHLETSGVRLVVMRSLRILGLLICVETDLRAIAFIVRELDMDKARLSVSNNIINKLNVMTRHWAMRIPGFREWENFNKSLNSF